MPETASEDTPSGTLPPGMPGARAADTELHYDDRVLRSLRRIVRSIELHSKYLSVHNRITAPQLVCLLVAANHGPLSTSALSREAHLSASTVVGILDRLEEKGWITRTRARDDRRVVMVAATEGGVALARSAPSPLQRRLSDALNALPELERATIALSLERVAALMEDQVTDQSNLLSSGIELPPAI